MMTRKHFEAIAGIIEPTEALGQPGAYERGWNAARKHIATQLADYLATENHNFDRERFLAACKVRETAV